MTASSNLPPTSRPADYQRARSLILWAGIAVLAVVAVIMFVRRVDPVEVVATLMFLPVFVAFVIGGTRAGVIAGLAAAVAYVLLRQPAIDAVGLDRFAGLLLTRALGYVAFGAIGGWAASQLRGSITKLELYDQIDDETGLHNSRAVIDIVDRERSRADRYREIFSVTITEARIPPAGRERARILSDLGAALAKGVRTVDSAMHAREGELDLFVVVLPETGAEGAATFGSKLQRLIGDTAPEVEQIRTTGITYPDDPDALESLIARFRPIVARDFPEAPTRT